jgi:hypothetical protein
MKKEKICPICEDGKQKRLCKLQHEELICITCCLKKQSYACNGCSFYQDKILNFKCSSCGKTSIDDQPSDITNLMTAKVFRLENLGGIKFKYGLVASGEIYTTSLEFPFEGKIDMPHWFYYDPEENFHTLQLIQGEISEIKCFDEYKAEIELFVHQAGKCRNVRDIFPEEEMPESLYNVDILFPVGSLAMRTFGNFVMISSMMQDGGNWALVCNDATHPRIILYAEGWFNHWQSYIGNIKIKKGFLQQIQNYANA